MVQVHCHCYSRLFLVVTGVVSYDPRVLQRVPSHPDKEEEIGVCHEPYEAQGLSGGTPSCREGGGVEGEREGEGGGFG